MRRSTAVVLAVAAVIATLVGAGTATAEPGEKSQGDEHRRIVELWTPEARAAAIERDVVLRGGPDGMGRKPGGGGGGTTPTTVTGTSWTALGAPVAITTGKVFFKEDNVAYVCSGSAVNATGADIVLTAGHCVHGGAGGGFVTDFIFYPNYGANPSNPPYGAWTATDLFTTPTWATGSSTNGSASKWNDDAGFAVVEQIKNGSVLRFSSAFGGLALPTIDFSDKGTALQSSFGYPAAKPYSGKTLTWCQGETRLTYDSNDTYGMPCNMTGGSSGGPWLTGMNADGSGGMITSLNSYGYSSLKNVMFGPVFDTDEANAFARAADGDCTSGDAMPCIDYRDPTAA